MGIEQGQIGLFATRDKVNSGSSDKRINRVRRVYVERLRRHLVVIGVVVVVVAWGGLGVRRKPRHLFLLLVVVGGRGGCGALCSGGGWCYGVLVACCCFCRRRCCRCCCWSWCGCCWCCWSCCCCFLLLLLLLLMLLLLLAERFASFEVASRSKRVTPFPLVGSESSGKLQALRSRRDPPETKRSASHSDSSECVHHQTTTAKTRSSSIPISCLAGVSALRARFFGSSHTVREL